MIPFRMAYSKIALTAYLSREIENDYSEIKIENILKYFTVRLESPKLISYNNTLLQAFKMSKEKEKRKSTQSYCE
ncbi:hypothetical protein DOY81_009297 [Sarcophaga bullata]|nr:hypothetical protein DOY81_009297 [Sarcophaga bullata]